MKETVEELSTKLSILMRDLPCSRYRCDFWDAQGHYCYRRIDDTDVDCLLARAIFSIFLDRTRDDCPECGGSGYSKGDYCLACNNTGKVGEPDPKRLVVLAKDQSFPPLPREDISHIIMERDNILLKDGFKKIRSR